MDTLYRGAIRFNEGGLAAIPNSLELDNDAILQNLQQLQADSDLHTDEEPLCIEENISLLGEEKRVGFPNFSVEMETGTGKTYVYLRTILELYRRYGLRKFIHCCPICRCSRRCYQDPRNHAVPLAAAL